MNRNNGEKKYVKDIKKNDLLMGNIKVLCVLKTNINNNEIPMVHLKNGLKITPYHPIKTETNDFIFPINLVDHVNNQLIIRDDIESIFSFVLEKDHIMMINDVECVTLGHGFQGECVSHPFFGTERVINELKKINGWDDGLIEIENNSLHRDQSTGLVNGFVINKQCYSE
jgi:hypothetical protein